MRLGEHLRAGRAARPTYAAISKVGHRPDRPTVVYSLHDDTDYECVASISLLPSQRAQQIVVRRCLPRF